MELRNARRLMLAGVLVATVFAAWLRIHGLALQVPVDDEWHAIHKLMNASYGEILRSFGLADHSIPLTLFYKALAETVGLDEVNLHALQVATGIALVGTCAALAWRVTANAAVTILFAFLLAGAPFLVLYSRFARPYAITTLLAVVVLAALWRWRSRRSIALGAGICALTALSAWLHPLTALFPAAGMAFLLLEDLGNRHLPRARSIFTLGIAAGFAMALPLALPIVHDFANLSSKASQHHPTAYTLFRMASIFLGGFPDAVTVLLLAVAAFGAWRFLRAHRDLGAYLLFVAFASILVVILLGASWTHQGHTFGRYVFPVQAILLFWLAYGAIQLVRIALRRLSLPLETAVVVVLVAAYLTYNPAIRQVRKLGAWYAHFYHHYDYVRADNLLADYWKDSPPPRFYRVLADLPKDSAPVIEAPFVFAAPVNRIARYAQFHRQREIAGLMHDLCVGGPYYGEVPHDPRFRFRSMVFLDDPQAVRRTGARYLLLHRDIVPGETFKQADACIAALTRLYGPPIDVDDRVAAFDLRPDAARKLQ